MTGLAMGKTGESGKVSQDQVVRGMRNFGWSSTKKTNCNATFYKSKRLMDVKKKRIKNNAKLLIFVWIFWQVSVYICFS